jgi:hypothetical protein
MSKPRRHKWSEANRLLYKTERQCRVCTLIKVTRHESGRAWIEYWRDGERIHMDKVPPCEARSANEGIAA